MNEVAEHNEVITNDLVDAIGEAFNKNDLDLVMGFFAENSIFDHGAGPEVVGKRFEGKESIRSAFSGLFDSVEFVHWETKKITIVENRAYCEFYRTARLKSGEDQEFLSFDILTFKDGLVVHKDTYFKNRSM